MVLAVPVVLGLAVGLVLGGSPARLGRLRLRAIPLVYLALALQLVAFPVRDGLWNTPDRLAIGLWLASYCCLGVAIVANIAAPGMPLLAGGVAANLAAILANGGHMPALPRALDGAGLGYRLHYNSVAAATPHLSFLVDRWAAPAWIPLANVYSVGDVLIALGAFVLALTATGARRLPTRGRSRGRKHLIGH